MSSPAYSMMQQSDDPSRTPHQTALDTPVPARARSVGAELNGPSQAGWLDSDAKEAWLNNLNTRLSGDDVAAFVDGSSWEDWAAKAGNGDRRVRGWLSTVWGAGARDIRT